MTNLLPTVIVPCDPTPEMLAAGAAVLHKYWREKQEGYVGPHELVERVWAAMTSSADDRESH